MLLTNAAVIRIEHVALWTRDLDRIADFYCTYFSASAGARYANPAKGFESVFLKFGDGARLEVMRSSLLEPVEQAPGAQRLGFTHLAVSLGSKQSVDELTSRLRRDGYEVMDGPRVTGDGYYESVVLDPDGNRIEVTI
jgi:lactoylglutathione lyase